MKMEKSGLYWFNFLMISINKCVYLVSAVDWLFYVNGIKGKEIYAKCIYQLKSAIHIGIWFRGQGNNGYRMGIDCHNYT